MLLIISIWIISFNYYKSLFYRYFYFPQFKEEDKRLNEIKGFVSSICIYCEMITTVKVINTPITSHSYLFLFYFVVRTPKMYFLNELQIYNAVLLILTTILYMLSQELTHLTISFRKKYIDY